MHFTKIPLTIDEKIALLKERGLLIPDEERASKYLNHIGYFRLTGYFKYYQNPETNQFYE
jgi:abortive infection bacteriophage resistance protein